MHTPRAPVNKLSRRHFRLGRLTHWRQCGHPTLFYTSTRNPPRETNLAISHSVPSVDISTIWCDTAIICHTFQRNFYSTSSVAAVVLIVVISYQKPIISIKYSYTREIMNLIRLCSMINLSKYRIFLSKCMWETDQIHFTEATIHSFTPLYSSYCLHLNWNLPRPNYSIPTFFSPSLSFSLSLPRDESLDGMLECFCSAAKVALLSMTRGSIWSQIIRVTTIVW